MREHANILKNIACNSGLNGYNTLFFQSKLTINQPNDIYEQEADAVADKVTRMSDTENSHQSFFKPVQRRCAHCEQEEGQKLQRKETNSQQTTSNNELDRYVDSLSNGGQSLPNETRSFFEPRLGHDFGSVKVHTDAVAAKSAQSINALAYTSGNHIVFNNGQYSPETDSGKRLLAHELTHVVQQANSIQLQPAPVQGSFSPQFTEEIIDVSSEDPMAGLSNLTNANNTETGVAPAMMAEESPSPFVQTKLFSSFLQRDTQAVDPPRKDYVFLMGSTGGFYLAAKKFFQDHQPQAEIISLKNNSLEGIFAKLREVASTEQPVGNLYIVSHANVDGTLSFGLTAKDKDKKTTFGELKNALATHPDLFNLNGGIDEKTKVHIKGCNIGRNLDMLNALDEAFGKKTAVDAPTHKQGYEYHSEKQGKTEVVVSSEFFNTYNVEFSGNVSKSDDEVVDAFKEKYSDFGFSDQDWEIAVLGVTKQGRKVDKDAAAKKADVDAELKANLGALDNKAADYKDEEKRLKEEAKTEKETITTEAKEAKKTDVAKGSKGADKKVITAFTVPLFNDALPPLTEPEILKNVRMVCPKCASEGWKFTSGSVTKERQDANDVYTYDLEGKKNGEDGGVSPEITMPAYPETDGEASSLAEKRLDEYMKEHPDFAVARKEIYDWRITRKKDKAKENIKAFLEMTIYSINLDLREKEGSKLDPATEEGKSFFYGQSDVE